MPRKPCGLSHPGEIADRVGKTFLVFTATIDGQTNSQVNLKDARDVEDSRLFRFAENTRFFSINIVYRCSRVKNSGQTLPAVERCVVFAIVYK